MYNLTSHEFDERDVENVINLFRGRQLTMGENVREFEKEISLRHGRSYGVMVNSGSSANLILFSALLTTGRLKKGDHVLVPAVSWSTTFYPIIQCGFVPVFIDVGIDSWTLTRDACEQAIRDDQNIKAIFFVSLLGSFSEYSSIERLAREKNIFLLVDNCEGFGSKCFETEKYFGGREAKAMSLSFFYSHQLPAIEGGMVLTDDEELFHHMLSLRAHGWTRDLPSDRFLPIDQSEFTRLFRFVLPGYCVRPMEINAVLGLERLKRWPSVSSVRSNNKLIFEQLFSNIDAVLIQKPHAGQSSFGFGVLMPSARSRDQLIDHCLKAGVQCRPIVAGNFLNNPVCDRIEFLTHGDFITADYIDTSGVFFGNSNLDLTENLKALSTIVQDATQS